MLGSEGLFEDRQRALIEWLSLRVVALSLVELRQVAEVDSDIRMVGGVEAVPANAPAPAQRGRGEGAEAERCALWRAGKVLKRAVPLWLPWVHIVVHP